MSIVSQKRSTFHSNQGNPGLHFCGLAWHIPLHTRFFYKNKLYKNIEAEKPWKFKNIIRICWGWDVEDENGFFNSLENFINMSPNFCILRSVFMKTCVHPFHMVEVVDTSCKGAQKRLNTVFISEEKSLYEYLAWYQNIR